MFSTIVLPKIMIMQPAAVPTRTLPMNMRATVPPIVIRAPTIAILWAIRAPFLRPMRIKYPPRKLPRNRPMMPAELMMVLLAMVSSSVQSNLASKTGVVYEFPARAQVVCQVPRP